MAKHLHLKTAWLLTAVLSIVVSCSPKTDLKHIDPNAELSMGLALPVGDIRLTLDDFLGMGQLSDYITIDNDSVLTYIDTFTVSRQFHSIDLSNYMSNLSTKLNVYSQLPTPIQTIGYIDGDGSTGFDMDFPLDIKFTGVNNNTENERLDSMVIKSAQFTSIFTIEDMNLDWDEIKQLDIILGPQFRRGTSQTVSLPIADKGFGQQIPINIDEFTLNLMKDPTQPVGMANVVDEAKMTVRMRVVPKAGKRINIASTSAIQYHLAVEFLDYYAIYGRFEGSDEMSHEDTIVLAEQWAGWNDLLSLNLPLAEPEIFMTARHYVGVPMIMYGRYLWVESEETGQKINATFNRDGSKTNIEIPLAAVSNTSSYDAYEETEFVFDEREEHGHLDKMFAIRPDILAYKFDIIPNYADVKQARLTQNTNIEIEAITTVPFIFNEGVDFRMTDTITDVHIDQFSIDSLLDKAEFVDSLKTANLKLILTAENYIPFDIDAHITFIDYKGDSIPLEVTEGNNLHISGPARVMGMDVAEATRSVNTLNIDKETMDRLSTVKAIKLQAGLGKNTVKVRLKSSNSIIFKIGLAFDVAAIFDMDKLLNSSENENNNQ